MSYVFKWSCGCWVGGLHHCSKFVSEWEGCQHRTCLVGCWEGFMNNVYGFSGRKFTFVAICKCRTCVVVGLNVIMAGFVNDVRVLWWS